MTDHKQRTKEQIAIMQAYVDGAEIEFRGVALIWGEASSPSWAWDNLEYRIKQATPDEINWDHVAPEFKWMARDESGECALFKTEPTLESFIWSAGEGGWILAESFASYVKGTCDWKDSLVERPLVKRACFTCKHHNLPLDREPCDGCGDKERTNWEPKP